MKPNRRLALALACALAFSLVSDEHAGADDAKQDLDVVETRLAFLGERDDPAIAQARNARARSLAFATEGRAAEARAETEIALAAVELAEARARLARDVAAFTALGRPATSVPRGRRPAADLAAALHDHVGGTVAEAATATASRLRAHARLATLRAIELEQALPEPTPHDVGEPPRSLAAAIALETLRETFAEASADERRRFGTIERKRVELRERARHDLLAAIPRRIASLASLGVEAAELEGYAARARELAREADHEAALVGLEDLADDLDARARRTVAR